MEMIFIVFITTLRATYEVYEVSENLKNASESHKRYLDRKAKEQVYDLNDLILLINNKKATKIDEDYIGPFLVVENSEISKNVITVDSLDCPGQTQKVSLSRVKPYMPCMASAILESEDSGPPRLGKELKNL
uniref:Uncharacterized protein n=1 Tax=Romanomermis culicivorax TaxID=13658 RepID=A0A915HQW0_ROMCU